MEEQTKLSGVTTAEAGELFVEQFQWFIPIHRRIVKIKHVTDQRRATSNISIQKQL